MHTFRFPSTWTLNYTMESPCRAESSAQAALLRLFHGSPGLHQGVFAGVRVGSQVRDSPSPVSGQLVSDCGFSPSSTETSEAPPQSLQRLGNCHQLGGIRSRADQRGSVSQNVDRYHPREDVAADPRSHGLSGTVCFLGRGGGGGVQLWPLHWQLKLHWSVATDDPAALVPLSEECLQCASWW